MIKVLVAKGLKDPAERLNVLRILDIVSVLDPLEASTRDTKDDADVLAFRVSLGGILNVYGTQLIDFIEEVRTSHFDLLADHADNRRSIPNSSETRQKASWSMLCRCCCASTAIAKLMFRFRSLRSPMTF